MLPSFWLNTGVQLRGHKDSQILFVYLVDGPASNAIGLFFASLAQAAEHTGLSPDEARAAFAHLASLDLAHHDESSTLTYVPRMAVHQTGVEMRPGSKRSKALTAELRPFGQHPFVTLWWALYRDPLGLSERVAAPATQTPLLGDGPPAQARRAPTIKRTGRLPLSIMTSEWQPDDHTRALIPAELDAGLILDDFRNYWLSQGKPMADWNAALRNNLTKIRTSDFLMRRFIKAEPAPVRRPRALPPPPPVGEPVPAPASLRRALEEGMGLKSVDDLAGGRDVG